MFRFTEKIKFYVPLLISSTIFFSCHQVHGVGIFPAKPSTATFPVDSFAGVINPAGMVLVGDRFDVSLVMERDRKHAEIEDNTVPGANGHYKAASSRLYYFPAFAINKTFKTQFCCCEELVWSLGIMAYEGFFCKTAYDRPVPLWGTSKLGVTILGGAVSPVFAVKINDNHTFGISIDFHILQFRVKGEEFFDAIPITVSPGHVTNNGHGYAFGVGPTFGWRWQINKKLSFGARYSPKVRMSKIHKYNGYLPDHGRADNAPMAIVGFGYMFTDKLAGFLDMEYIGWSKMQAGYAAFGNPRPLGSNHGKGYGWQSQYVYATGAAYTVSECFTVRGAYLHTRSQTRRHETFTNMQTVETEENMILLGATYTLCKKNEISFYWLHGFKHKIRGFDGGIPDVLGGGRVNLSSSYDQFAVGYGYKF